MTEFKIEKDVPIPSASYRNSKYPWTAMEVGDSIVVPSSLASLSGSLNNARRKGIKLVARTIDANSCRVWRVE